MQVGGGPTGVETAAELYDLLAEDVARSVPSIKARAPPLQPHTRRPRGGVPPAEATRAHQCAPQPQVL